MTSTTATSLSTPQRHEPLISAKGWLWIAVLGGLFVLLFRNFLFFMARVAWNESADWGHAMLVPVISLYFIHINRERVLSRPLKAGWPGLAFMLVGLLAFAVSIFPGRNDMLQGYSMVLCLFGMVWLVVGTPRMMILWFPVLYLVLGIKVAPKLWDHIAWKLQLIAASLSTVLLRIIGSILEFEAANRGSTIELSRWVNGRRVTEALNVEEACAGLRMLMAFIALGAAVAFLADRSWWQRAILVAFTVPVAVAINVGRVTVLGLLFLVDPKYAQGNFHTFIGMLMLVPALGLFLLVGWIVDHLVIDDGVSESRRSRHEAVRSAAPGSASTLTRSGSTPGKAWGVPGKGAMVGVVLTLGLIGIFALSLWSMRPELFGNSIFGGASEEGAASPAILSWLPEVLLVASVLIGAGVWLVVYKKMIRPIAADARKTRGLAMGVAVGVLLTATGGLNAVVVMTKTVLIKEPIPLRMSLSKIPSTIGPWELVAEDPPLPPEQLETLGTEMYISRTYADKSLPKDDPASIAKLHVTYYTGKPDTAPHVPDRCYVAGGMKPVNIRETTLHFTGPAYSSINGLWFAASQLPPGRVHLPSNQASATLFTFTGAKSTQAANVIYFFSANGKFLSTPEGVRLQGFDPRDRYSYYAKIEVLMPLVSDTQRAVERVETFLSYALPEVQACLPDWDKATGKKLPTQSNPVNRPIQ
ncbi:MAG: exosortase [Phycisphaera sp.]|nr:exosortase [Phycisphaera sp.]